MAEKLSWTELRRVLATRAGVSEKKANAFLNALTAELTAGLKEDKQVKINGLGSFKLQAVAPRKSVNIATGEEITIEGYNKLVFSPEAGVKELIEKGASPLPSPEGEGEKIDPLQKLGTQAEEIVDILGELGQSPKEKEEEPTPTLPEGNEETKFEPEPVVVPEPVKEPEPVYIPETNTKTDTMKKEEKEVKEEKGKKRFHFVRDVLICVVILLLLLFGAYFFLREQIGGWIDELLQGRTATELVVPADTTAQEIAEPVEAEPADLDEEELTEEQILKEFLEISGETEEAEAPEKMIYEDLITIEPMHEASRLVWMAKRFYGAKVYWPYLYDANKDHISNPCLIDVGTPIRVPRLTSAQKDTTNAKTRATLERLRLEAEAACGK